MCSRPGCQKPTNHSWKAALDDRSIAVGRAAALVLAQLPGSALVARMTERAERILTYTPPARGGFLRAVGRSLGVREGTGTLTFTPPTELDPAWQRDGLREKTDAGIDEHAWWAMRTLTHVPAAHWTTRFAATPAELIAAAAQHELHAAIIGGWTQAALLEGDEGWASPPSGRGGPMTARRAQAPRDSRSNLLQA